MASLLGGILQATGSFDPHLPRRNLTSEANQYIRALPTILQAQQFFDPQLAGLAEESQVRRLFGSEGGVSDVTTYGFQKAPRTITTPVTGAPPAPGMPVTTGIRGVYGAAASRAGTPGAPGSSTTTRNPDAGKYVLKPTTTQVYTPQTEGLFSITERAGGELNRINQQISPEYSQLLASLMESAQEDVEAGNELTPDQLRLLQQNVRQGQAARGQGFGAGDTIREAVASVLRGMDVREGRLGSARSTAGLYRSSMPTWQDALRVATGVGAPSGVSDFVNPFNPYNADLQNTNFGARAYEEIAKMNNRKQGLDSIADSTMSLIGMGMGGMCWVAREVYGEDDPRWLAFREWLLTTAPAKTVELYVRFGVKLAERLKALPALKAQLRTWMDAQLSNHNPQPTTLN